MLLYIAGELTNTFFFSLSNIGFITHPAFLAIKRAAPTSQGLTSIPIKASNLPDPT